MQAWFGFWFRGAGFLWARLCGGLVFYGWTTLPLPILAVDLIGFAGSITRPGLGFPLQEGSAEGERKQAGGE
jgi:hypothetical protein